MQNRNDITFPFRRYQIQNVWRADRPQKGRFREFYQCDADIIGTQSLLAEVELVQLYDDVFSSIGLKDFTIKINNRKILNGIADVIGETERILDITTALDKLDKIGQNNVKQEMLSKGVSTESIEKMNILFSINGTNSDKLNALRSFLKKFNLLVKKV